MQRDHSCSDSKQRLQWDLIHDDEEIQPPRKKRKLNEHGQELEQHSRSQNSTPREA